MKKIALVLATTFMVGCSSLLPSSQVGGVTVVLSPKVHQSGYLTKTAVNVYTAASIHHLVIKLFQGATEVAAKTIAGSDLNKAVTFSNLRANTSYRVRCYAYLADNTPISKDATSWVDIVTETNDAPLIAPLPVFLSDILFNGVGTGTIQVTNGGYSFAGVEKLFVPLTGVVTTFAGVKGSWGTIDGIGTNAKFDLPLGLAISGNDLYVADHDRHTIRKILLTTGEVSTYAGSPGATGTVDGVGTSARFNIPCGLALDGNNLYVADEGNNAVRKIDLTTKEVTTLAGTIGASGSLDAVGTNAKFWGPFGILVNGNNLYVSESGNSVIRQIDLTTKAVSLFAGTMGITGFVDGVGNAAQFYKPRGLAVDGANLYVADDKNHAIRKVVLATKEVSTFAGGAIGTANGVGTIAQLNRPYGLATDGTNLYVADDYNHAIRQIDLATRMVTTLAGTPGATGSVDATGANARFYNPVGLVMWGNSLFVSDNNNCVIRFIQ